MINTIQYLYTKDQQIFGELKYSDTLFSEYKKHFHTHFGLALITYGELEITYDADTIRHLDNHAIALFNPLQVHQTKALDATGYYVLFLDKQWCETLHEHFYISDNIVKDKYLYQSFKALFRTILVEQEYVTEAVVSKIMQDLFQKYGTVHTPKESSTLIQIKKIIEENNETSFSVEDLAKEVGYDKSYLIRMFKKEVGLTPQQYILNIKVNRAKDLLTYTQGESLSRISVDAGFFDQSHFHRNFKGLFGENPNRYKHVNIIQDKKCGVRYTFTKGSLMQTIQYNNQSITPSKVICVGRNYVEHIKELNNETPDTMVLFNKPNSAITNELRYIQEDCRFEGEICFLIQDSQITGIGFGLDLTKAGIQNKMKEKGLPWERAKGFDGSAVFSKFVPFVGDIQTIEMKLFRNANLAQHATYDLMIYKPDNILSEIQTFMTLDDGDIIMSGTPKGVATYAKGDSFVGEIYVDNTLVVKEEFIAK